MDISKGVFFLMLLLLYGQSYTQENAPLYMYLTPDDLQQAFGISSGNIKLVIVNWVATNDPLR